MCPIDQFIRGFLFVVIFIELGTCCHPIILDWDFLTCAGAVIDCCQKGLYLNAIEMNISPPSDDSIHLCTDENNVIKAIALTAVRVLPKTQFLEALDYVEPITDTFMKKNLLLPHSIINMNPLENCLFVTSMSCENSFIAEGTCLAHFTPMNANFIEAFRLPDVPGKELLLPSAWSVDDILGYTIDLPLPASQQTDTV